MTRLTTWTIIKFYYHLNNVTITKEIKKINCTFTEREEFLIPTGTTNHLATSNTLHKTQPLRVIQFTQLGQYTMRLVYTANIVFAMPLTTKIRY